MCGLIVIYCVALFGLVCVVIKCYVCGSCVMDCVLSVVVYVGVCWSVCCVNCVCVI